MRFSEIRGEHALDVLADMIDPFTEIMADPEIKNLILSNNKLGTVKYVLKNYKPQVLTILALMEDEDPETYKPNLLEIPIKLLQLLNDPAFKPFFTSQGQNPEKTSSGSVTENTEAKNE